MKKFYAVFSICTTIVVLFAWVGGVWDHSPLKSMEDFDRERAAKKQTDLLKTVPIKRALTVTIPNNDDFDWTDVKITLNSEYELKVPRMAAGKEREFSYSQFTKSDGTRFNFGLVEPKEIVISAHTPYGASTWVGDF